MTTALWTIPGTDPDDVALVLPVLRLMIQESAGLARTLTRDAADWAIWFSRACPGIPPAWVRDLTAAYTDRIGRDAPTDDLDLLLSFQPWSEEGLWAYLGVLAAGNCEGPPAFLWEALLRQVEGLPSEPEASSLQDLPISSPTPRVVAALLASGVLGGSTEGILKGVTTAMAGDGWSTETIDRFRDPMRFATELRAAFEGAEERGGTE